MRDDHEQNDVVDLDQNSLRIRLEELKAKLAALQRRVTLLEEEQQRESTPRSE